MADGSIEFSTTLDNKQLEKDLRSAEKLIDGLKGKIEKSEASKNAIEQEMESAKRLSLRYRFLRLRLLLRVMLERLLWLRPRVTSLVKVAGAKEANSQESARRVTRLVASARYTLPAEVTFS